MFIFLPPGKFESDIIFKIQPLQLKNQVAKNVRNIIPQNKHTF